MKRKILTRGEEGFTMVATMVGITVMAAMALVAVTAVRGDIPLYSKDINSKRAYEAAHAGIEEYAYHLYGNPLYWKECTGGGTNARNQINTTTNRRKIPGDTTAEYAIELIPATGKSSCSTTSPIETMLETNGTMTGSFRIRSTGFVDTSKVSLTATFKRPSFLDYVYFTQRETSDPVTYGYPNPSTALTGAYSQCELTYQQGRYNNPIPGTNGNDYCNKISFVTGDKVNGPLHSNDTLAICGDPVFGREASDVIEMAAKYPGWYANCSGSDPVFTGSLVAPAAILVPPESNSKLKTIVSSGYKYTGQVYICLENSTYRYSTTTSNCSSGTSKSLPSNGVIYVENGTGCSSVYSPFTATYPTTSACGNVYIKGTYTGELTIAAENDIIVNGSVCRGSCGTATGNGILGLIANNFVRIYHPYPNETTSQCNSNSGEVQLPNLNIDAAILAINHSFIVDHYDCGNQMGNLNVEGAIAQKFRGPVGTTGGTGYIKNYVYDNRFRYIEPPSFIEPTGTAWVIGRLTES